MFPQYQLVTDELVWINAEWQYQVLVDGMPVWWRWSGSTDNDASLAIRFELLKRSRADFAKRCQDVFSPDGWF